MNTRALSIIKILLNSVEPVSSLALSQEIGCSTKTIQNEIKEVNKELKNCEIVSIRGIGYKIEGNLDDIDIKNSDLYDYDRVEYIIKKIINISSTDKDTIKLEDLADSMYVSLSTVKNDLKEVNDTLGHIAGDTLIMNFAHIIRTSIPEKYFVGRYGGDEFIALLNDVSEDEVKSIIKKVQDEANRYNEFSKQIYIEFAYGYALSINYQEANLKVLLNQADKNMYECKTRMKQAKQNLKK